MNTSKDSLRLTTTGTNPWLALLLWVAVCAVAGFLGSIASINAPGFYGSLDRPDWAPPAAVFGPVWSVLYVLMAVAAWLVWRERGWARAGGALGLFLVQLAVNAIWSWLFFAWREGGLAFADIALLVVLLLATLVAFARVKPLAAWLLAPYLAWVLYATALNWSVWQRNPQLL